MPGALCISIDVELAWGIWDKPHDDYHTRCARYEQEIIRSIVRLFERHEVSATWAIVGRLLELDDAATASTPHGSQIWHAPALIDLIRQSRVPQDIGSHSYAHLYFGEVEREQIRDDLRAARRVHDTHGLPFTSFVFPRNQVAHVDLLKEAGIKVFRSVDLGWYVDVRRRLGRTAGRVAHLADKLLPTAPASIVPIMHDGIVELPSSMLLMARQGVRRLVPSLNVIAKARRGLDEAKRTGRCFHLWFHPSNFYYDMPRQLETLDAILASAGRMRARGELAIKPMNEFALDQALAR